MLNMLGMILIVLLMFTIMVVVHEWGHYITAKKSGVLVHEFAVGMGPIVWSKQKGETVYSIRLLPIGGFCRMEGEEGSSKDPRAMASKKPWQKLIIIAAGAVMNFVLAWVLLMIIFTITGYSSNKIERVEKDTPAYTAGMQNGDRIIEINGHHIYDFEGIDQQLSDKPASYQVIVKRGNEKIKLIVDTVSFKKNAKPRFGVMLAHEKNSLLGNIKYSFIKMLGLIRLVWDGFVKIVTGAMGLDQMSSVVAVVDAGNQIWTKSMAHGGLKEAIIKMLYLMALLSANLGVVNLLPLPALDGGRIFFILIEMVRGKAISAEKEGAVHFIGLVLLMLLTIVVMYNDVMRLIR